MVKINFSCGGKTVSETAPLDFGTVQAGTSSAIKKVDVVNTGDSDSQQCTIEAVEATLSNGFTMSAQAGTSDETVLAQEFSNDATTGNWYKYAVLGVGKEYASKQGGTLSKGNGRDSFVTRWSPPSGGSSGQKTWGNVFSCVYV